jgi:ABC-2 type transport system ATP-binding protein
VFVSSHVLSEVQHIAHRVALIRDGRLELVDDVESLRQRALTRVEVTFAEPPPPGAFDGVAGVREVGRNGEVVRLTLEGSADPLVKTLGRYEVRAIDSHEADLEDVFLELYRRPTGAG